MFGSVQQLELKISKQLDLKAAPVICLLTTAVSLAVLSPALPAVARESDEASLRLRADVFVNERTVNVGDIGIFYREAGRKAAPTLLILHGFQNSSRFFRIAIAALSDKYHVIAPDLPGFGRTTTPDGYSYTFAHLREAIANLTDALSLSEYAIYMADYSSLIGYFLALRNPERVTAIISQNALSLDEDLSAARWSPALSAYWQNPTPTNRRALQLVLEQQISSQRDKDRAAKTSVTILHGDLHFSTDFQEPADNTNIEALLDLLRDYETNAIAIRSELKSYLLSYAPPCKVLWDPSALPLGTSLKDVPATPLKEYYVASDTKFGVTRFGETRSLASKGGEYGLMLRRILDELMSSRLRKELERPTKGCIAGGAPFTR